MPIQTIFRAVKGEDNSKRFMTSPERTEIAVEYLALILPGANRQWVNEVGRENRIVLLSYLRFLLFK